MGVAVPVVVLTTAAMTAALRVLVSVPANAAPLGPVLEWLQKFSPCSSPAPH